MRYRLVYGRGIRGALRCNGHAQGTCVSLKKDTIDNFLVVDGAISLELDEDGWWDESNDPLEDIDGENNLSPLGAQYGQV
jgi:hypothetical protein